MGRDQITVAHTHDHAANHNPTTHNNNQNTNHPTDHLSDDDHSDCGSDLDPDSDSDSDTNSVISDDSQALHYHPPNHPLTHLKHDRQRGRVGRIIDIRKVTPKVSHVAARV
jgi:hypothetical protein